ncbi:MAG TPA: hypothetical protein VFS66_01775 [Acidimicrobiia bacterium]|nr:hypothetical protein [Acidimicrobiia bacterium]
MEPERDEVYERIPWETLQQKGGERNWIVYAVAGAIALGALGYSFMRSQPEPPAPIDAGAETTVPVTTPPEPATPATVSPQPVASPVVVAEADLYAVDQGLYLQKAASHAEWFAVEFVSVDGDEKSRALLESLLPPGSPLPESEPGIQVFVDWAGAREVIQSGATTFEVEVLVRSLVSRDGALFTRVPPLLLAVPVELDGNGDPVISGLPSQRQPDPGQAAQLDLVEVPPDVVSTLGVEGEVLGGRQLPDGGWEVVVVGVGADGVRRPFTVRA